MSRRLDPEAESPLLAPTPRRWAELAAQDLPAFLADHAVCEQQAALTALGLIGQYPDDTELVARMGSLAAEEVAHLRRVSGLLERRGWPLAKRRSNPWVRGLRERMRSGREPDLKTDRLLVGALIEARSCERFTLLGGVVEDREVREMLADLGPAERRHWQMFHALAGREIEADALESRWREWLEIERELNAQGGVKPTVHG